MNEYRPALFKEAWKVPQMRTIPIGRSIDPLLEVLPYERAEELIRDKNKAVVAPCICRRERLMTGHSCGKPLETCISFDMAAEYYRRNGLGRETTIDEVRDILRAADEAGLVLQPSNSRDPLFICCCCGDCCGVLNTVKKFPKPAALLSTSFQVSADPETCEGCGICIDRCQMEALRLEDDTIQVDLDRCIGCGLCVSACPTDSLALKRKDHPAAVPKDLVAGSIKLAKARNRISNTDIAMMMIRSKVDRLLAS
jgi:ferredoxin